MNKEFNLSNEIEEYAGWKDGKISVEKVKEFIRLLKDNFYKTMEGVFSIEQIHNKIDKLAGEKLK